MEDCLSGFGEHLCTCHLIPLLGRVCSEVAVVVESLWLLQIHDNENYDKFLYGI